MRWGGSPSFDHSQASLTTPSPWKSEALDTVDNQTIREMNRQQRIDHTSLKETDIHLEQTKADMHVKFE